MSSGTRHWRPDRRGLLRFYVDVVGGCNLRCPSCPVGNSRETRAPGGHMTPEMLDRIVGKARREWRGELWFDLFNWTEPFLHPRLPEMVRVVRSHDLPCGLSTNLNLLKNLDEVLAAGPTTLAISLSGFRQETYGVTHARGDIEVVKSNMARLAEAKRRAGAATAIRVSFHRYLGNHEDEGLMREYAESLGFELHPGWAGFYPLEKLLGAVSPGGDGLLTDEDRRTIDQLALPLDEAIAVCRDAVPRKCHLLNAQVTLTVTGRVMLCCAVFDQSRFGIGSYLDEPLEEIQAQRQRHTLCDRCMAHGLHQLFAQNLPELDELALARVAAAYPQARLEGAIPKRVPREPRRLREVPSRIWGELRRFRGRIGKTLTGWF